MATEEMAYEVLDRMGTAELREYAPSIVAQTTVRGRFESVGNVAFQRLAGYIFGQNRRRVPAVAAANGSSERIAMTAPVLQEPSEKIAMTAPVLQVAQGRSWLVTFVMPAGSTIDTLPEPVDAKVRLVERPGQLMVALRYSGTWGQSRFDQHRRALERLAERHGFVPTGPAVFARYDPPFTPWFRRRNEVLIPVERAEA